MKSVQIFVSFVQKRGFSSRFAAFTEDLCNGILDRVPGVKTLRILHGKILKDRNLRWNSSLGIKLMRAYAANGEPRIARQVFDEIPERNVVFFNVMIRGYVNNHLYFDGLYLYKTMISQGFYPDMYTYPCVLKACSGSDSLLVGLQTHAAIVKVGFDSNQFVGNGLVSVYGKCGRLKEARQVLDEIPSRDVVSWNSMVAVYAQNGCFNEALETCREMELSNLKPDSCTMASLLPAVTNTFSANVQYMREMFVNLAKKCVISWNVMIAVCMKNGMSKEAVDLYLEMEANGVEPNEVSVSSILPACGDLSALSLGRKIHEYAKEKKLLPNLLVENALIDMYAKCGCLWEARAVFDRMKTRDVASWTSMISAYGTCGQGTEAVELFEKLQNSGLVPDSIAFVSVLAACSHSGLPEKGQYFFNQMPEFGISPKLEHFACMVDILGRSGKITEAYNLIKKMPLEPNERIWGALLSACRVHNNMDIGLLAADQVFQLVPEQCGYYVLLSNIYAKAGRWKDVEAVRLIMFEKGIKKTPGFSNVELDSKVHTFLAGDQSHPQSKEIYRELDVLVGKMRAFGYMAETDSALHDVEEEDKECHLVVHSEKLAIVFAMINTRPGTLIRVTKNLRVCCDCHVAIKLISRIAEREIVVRDTHRFHHFRGGLCSCGDYW